MRADLLSRRETPSRGQAGRATSTSVRDEGPSGRLVASTGPDSQEELRGTQCGQRRHPEDVTGRLGPAVAEPTRGRALGGANRARTAASAGANWDRTKPRGSGQRRSGWSRQPAKAEERGPGATGRGRTSAGTSRRSGPARHPTESGNAMSTAEAPRIASACVAISTQVVL